MRTCCMLVALGLAGCGGSDAGDHEDPAQAGTGGSVSGGGGTSSGGTTGGGTAGIAGGGGTSSGGMTGGGTGGQVTTDDRLQPFEVGRRWTYVRGVPDPALPSVECAEPLESYVAATVEMDDQTGWDYHPTCVTDYSVHMFVEGDDIWGWLSTNMARVQYAKAPISDGAAWVDGTTQFMWQDEGSVTVPAGSFDRCWRRAQVMNSENYLVLCRGVGLVITHAAAANYRLELSSKNF